MADDAPPETVSSSLSVRIRSLWLWCIVFPLWLAGFVSLAHVRRMHRVAGQRCSPGNRRRPAALEGRRLAQPFDGEDGRKFEPARRRCFADMACYPLLFRFIAARRAEASAKAGGGRGGIRTHGTLAGTPVFKTGALNHSATLPSLEVSDLAGACGRGKREIGRCWPGGAIQAGRSQAASRGSSYCAWGCFRDFCPAPAVRCRRGAASLVASAASSRMQTPADWNTAARGWPWSVRGIR